MMKKICLTGMWLTIVLVAAGCNRTTVTDADIDEIAGAVLQPVSQLSERESAIELPTTYSYLEDQEMPKLRNQEGENTCWIFASLSALESSKNENVSGPYSAEHLLLNNPYQKDFEEGGSYVVTMSYLLSWMGPVLEGKETFDGDLGNELTPDVHVQEIRQIEPKDYDAIKRFVYLYGGVESALYLDFDEVISESAYYNEETNAYCYVGDRISNHDVVILGWDDDYPAENFKGNVSEDGAFLCQNSWGENFGDKGIFYVSYEDVNIGGYGVVYSRIDSSDNYDRIYQSDLCGFTAQIGYNDEACWFANVYQAEEPISVRAAGFYATEKNTQYEVYLVNDFQDKNSLNDRKFICKGFLEDAGYYTIDFPESVNVDHGNEFAVVVKIKTKNAEYPVAIECPVDGLCENVDISDGKGYLSYQGSRWEHVESTKEYNLCLKVYADLQ